MSTTNAIATACTRLATYHQTVKAINYRESPVFTRFHASTMTTSAHSSTWFHSYQLSVIIMYSKYLSKFNVITNYNSKFLGLHGDCTLNKQTDIQALVWY